MQSFQRQSLLRSGLFQQYFQKGSEQLHDRKLGMVASDIMYVKPCIFVVEKQLLQYLLTCALHLSSWELKCYYNQRYSMGTNRESVVPGNLCII